MKVPRDIERPPHAATRPVDGRRPHPATVAQRSVAPPHAATVPVAGRRPHPATVAQRSAAPHAATLSPPAVAARARAKVTQRAEKENWDWDPHWSDDDEPNDKPIARVEEELMPNAGMDDAMLVEGIRSADKRIYRSRTNPSVGYAIAKSRAKDEIVWNEAQNMAAMQNDDVLTVLHGNGPRFYRDPTTGEVRVGFPMRWIVGTHSKTEKDAFEWALRDRRGNGATSSSLGAIESYVGQKHGIRDLQVMIETATGRLFVVDPRGLTDPDPNNASVRRWRALLTNAEPTVGRGNIYGSGKFD